MLNSYAEYHAKVWENASVNFPEFTKSYTKSEKLKKELALDQFLKLIKGFRKKRMNQRSMKEADQEMFFSNIRRLLAEGMDFTAEQLEIMFSDEMIGITRSFVRQAHAFDSKLPFPDIFQACRNVWIMNGIQLILGIPMQLTPPVFAYSLLYPYSDNLIDDPLISPVEKMSFSIRFRERLAGHEIKPANTTEFAVFRLVGMIESAYPRIDFPEIYESLLSIHEAQTNSMKLITPDTTLNETEILKICLTKGGASVLTDGYLVAGKLTPEQRHFLFGFGAYLQMLDDIQDLAEDAQAGLMTIFSKTACQSPLDEKLNKTYRFGGEVMKSLDRFDGQKLDIFKSLLRKSMDLFVTEAIAQNPQAYSSNYSSKFEEFSPFHFNYIRNQKEKFVPYNGFLLTAIEEIAFSESAILT
jgi:hypothetical protein